MTVGSLCGLRADGTQIASCRAAKRARGLRDKARAMNSTDSSGVLARDPGAG